MGRPLSWCWSPARKAWILTGRTGRVVAAVDENGWNGWISTVTQDDTTVGSTALIQAAAIAGVASLADAEITSLVVAGGGAITKIMKVSGTLPLITAVGTCAVAVSTMSAVASAGVAVGDLVFVRAKSAIGGHIFMGGAYVPTTNVINFLVANVKPESAGSFVAVGADALVIRSA